MSVDSTRVSLVAGAIRRSMPVPAAQGASPTHHGAIPHSVCAASARGSHSSQRGVRSLHDGRQHQRRERVSSCQGRRAQLQGQQGMLCRQLSDTMPEAGSLLPTTQCCPPTGSTGNCSPVSRSSALSCLRVTPACTRQSMSAALTCAQGGGGSRLAGCSGPRSHSHTPAAKGESPRRRARW